MVNIYKPEQMRLVEAIERALGHALSPQLKGALLAVDRLHFVPTYYAQDRPGQWWPHETSKEAYTDEALVTKLNTYHLPCSSSSQPSIMALMLEALSLQSGQHVLEIGTGTGYNAALLAELVGPTGSVVSVERDEE